MRAGATRDSRASSPSTSGAEAARLPASVRRAIIAHARREVPLECCGFLVGRAGVVEAAEPMPNVAASDTRFHVDERAHIELRRKLRRLEPPLEIVGVYHSHPAGPPVPSPTDLAEAHYPEWIYVIVGLGRPRAAVCMWSIVGGRADEVG